MNHLSRRGFLHSVGAATIVATVAGRVAAAQETHAAPAAAGQVRFGVQIVPQHTTYADILQTMREADELGFDTGFLFDHFIPIMSDPTGPCFEGWTLLSAMAAQTKRIKVGLLVTGNTYRNPALVAKMAATVDHVSNGRVILGLGAAWFESEHTAYGIPFYTPGERAKRLGEAVEVIKLLLTQPKSSFNGKYYQLKDAPCEPKPVQKPHLPLLIGGVGPKRIQPLAARHADIWHFFPASDGDVKSMCEKFDTLCQQAGRDPAQVEKSMSLRAQHLAGSTEEVRGHVQSFVDAGVRHLIVSLSPPYDHALMRTFAKEVIPAFRKA
ncbi:MAG: TIGR03560 family F420-dependent LLM class oxidoreductase [Deltaproteobacteria bacterium]|nr:TIGR03560 family F420-dependent LLM class oxidoreductase [Deltaproteobacteria bacterium]